jgi:ppGpp synthetase/RelA/SpoT-type nucleotidyltranferase
MAARKRNDKEAFLKRNHIEEIYPRAAKIDGDLWSVLQDVGEAYIEYAKNCDAIAQRLLLEILSDKKIKDKIHSARYRIKDKESLQAKIIRKKGDLSQEVSEDYEKEKYRNLDVNNYYKIITDLIGFRIIVRYREQWLGVHNWIFKKYYKGDEWFIQNYVEDYRSSVVAPFIAEKPKIYYRNRQERAFYEQVGRDYYELIESDEGYNSIHYIINIDGKYIEIQVRTIFDEAWSECTHDIVYKNKNKKLRNELNYLSRCLAEQTIASESMVNLMYEKVHKSSRICGDIGKMTNIPLIKADGSEDTDDAIINKSNVEKRILQLKKTQTDKFDGSIDKLI